MISPGRTGTILVTDLAAQSGLAEYRIIEIAKRRGLLIVGSGRLAVVDVADIATLIDLAGARGSPPVNNVPRLWA